MTISALRTSQSGSSLGAEGAGRGFVFVLIGMTRQQANVRPVASTVSSEARREHRQHGKTIVLHFILKYERTDGAPSYLREW